MNNPIEMLSVKEVSERAGVSEFCVRQGVKNKTFPHVKAGRKILIAWANVERFLTGGVA